MKGSIGPHPSFGPRRPLTLGHVSSSAPVPLHPILGRTPGLSLRSSLSNSPGASYARPLRQSLVDKGRHTESVGSTPVCAYMYIRVCPCVYVCVLVYVCTCVYMCATYVYVCV